MNRDRVSPWVPCPRGRGVDHCRGDFVHNARVVHHELEAAGRFREALSAVEQRGGADPYRDLVADELATDRGRLLWRNARFDEAKRVLELALADRRARLGEDHPDTLETLERMAAVAHYQVRDDVAVARFEHVIARLEGTLGPHHLRTGVAKRNYAACLRDIGDDARAFTMLADATRTIGRHCGRESPEAVAVFKVEALLTVMYGGDPHEALRLAREAVEISTSVHGADHALTAAAALTLASAQLRNKRPYLAIELAGRAARCFETSYGRHPLLGLALDRQAAGYAATGMADAALAALRDASRAYVVAYPTELLPAFGEVLNVLLENQRPDDVLAETTAALARPLNDEHRAYAVSFRDAALEQT